MEKPITVLQDELANSIVNAINDSKLHVALVEPVIKEIYESVVKSLLQQKQKEKEDYENSLKENQED